MLDGEINFSVTVVAAVAAFDLRAVAVPLEKSAILDEKSATLAEKSSRAARKSVTFVEKSDNFDEKSAIFVEKSDSLVENSDLVSDGNANEEPSIGEDFVEGSDVLVLSAYKWSLSSDVESRFFLWARAYMCFVWLYTPFVSLYRVFDSELLVGNFSNLDLKKK